MTTIEYRTVDKSAWGEGPWQGEPDKRQWTDEKTGLPCLIVRGPMGALCGYVGVAPGHPLHGRDHQDERVAQLEAHGEVNFADGCDHSPNPAIGVCHIPEPGEPDHVWWFGFDCCHAWDFAPGWPNMIRYLIDGEQPYRDVAYVTAQVEALAEQLAEVARA